MTTLLRLFAVGSSTSLGLAIVWVRTVVMSGKRSWTMSSRTYRARVELEFFVDADSAEEVEPAVQVFMNHIAEADEFLESPYAWDFADWNITEVYKAEA
jgi:hypothetical protein